MNYDAIRCPATGQMLVEVTLADAETRIGAPLVPLRLPGRAASGRPAQPPVGATERVLLREDGMAAYPVVDGIPVLLIPEMLGAEAGARAFDLADPCYAEAYDEMEFYNAEAEREARDVARSTAFAILDPVLRSAEAERTSFPEPLGVWIDAVYDCAAQYDAYAHLAPLAGRRLLQLGGKGIHAVKFLLAGAAEAWSVSPMLGEAMCARALAVAAGVADRMVAVVGVAERIPVRASLFHGIYSGGCVHHMVTSMAFAEAARVLHPGGRFAAVEPWRAPLYGIGTRVFGKREKNAYWRPLTPERVAPLGRAFPRARLVRHGTLTRYPLLALKKLGLPLGLRTAWTIGRLDDAVSSAVPGLRRAGSSVALLGSK